MSVLALSLLATFGGGHTLLSELTRMLYAACYMMPTVLFTHAAARYYGMDQDKADEVSEEDAVQAMIEKFERERAAKIATCALT